MKRKEGQSLADYHKEMHQRNKNIDAYLKGRVIFTGGTYDAGRNKAKRGRRQK